MKTHPEPADRDESKDIQVSAESLTMTRENSTYPFSGQFLPYVAGAPSDLSGWVRFVQYDQYAALEKERDELRAAVDKLTDKTLAIEEFHDRDTDGPHVLGEAYLMYRCIKCNEALCQDGSDEPIDGLTADLNGHTVACKCGAEYIGYTIDTPKLSLIQIPDASSEEDEDEDEGRKEEMLYHKDYDYPCGY